MTIPRNRSLPAALPFALATTAPIPASPQPSAGYNQKVPNKVMTPDSVDSRIATLKFFDGFPTTETSQKLS